MGREKLQSIEFYAKSSENVEKDEKFPFLRGQNQKSLLWSSKKVSTVKELDLYN